MFKDSQTVYSDVACALCVRGITIHDIMVLQDAHCVVQLKEPILCMYN